VQGDYKVITEGGVVAPRVTANRNWRVVLEDVTVEPNDYGFILLQPGKVATLPSATISLGKEYELKNASGGNLTISAASGETIEGLASVTVPTGAAGRIVSDGTQWWIISVY